MGKHNSGTRFSSREKQHAYFVQMASANVELVRSIYVGWERGDYSSTDWAHRDIELVIPDGPDPGRWRGISGMTATARARLSAFERVHAKADEFRELDGERVLVLEHRSGRGKASRLELGPLEAQGAKLFHIHEGKVVRLVDWWSRQRALADLGLASEGESPRR